MTSASFFLLLLLPFFQHSSLVAGYNDLIQETCQRTQYPDLCKSTIQSDQSSNRTDTKGLAVIVIRKAEASAAAASMYLLNLKFKEGTNRETHRVLSLCADKYAYASKALQASLEELAINDYDFASLEVSIAREYSNACGRIFNSPVLTYPPNLAQREELVEHLCDITSGIINLLG